MSDMAEHAALVRIAQWEPTHDDIPTCPHLTTGCDCWRHQRQVIEQNRQSDERAAHVLRGIARRALGITA